MHSTVSQFDTELHDGESAIDALCRISQLPEAVITDAAIKGAVWVSLQRGRGQTRPRRLRTLTTPVSQGSTVMLNYNPTVLAEQPLDMQCLSDQLNYGIWFKPSGMLCQGSKWSDHTTLTQVATGIRGKTCHLVHRLDRAACGLIVIAYTKNALRALSELFVHQKISKTYVASVAGKFTPELPKVLDTPIDDRHAITTLQAWHFNELADTTSLRLAITTGRKHQIRKHLAETGYPIIGDRLYARSDLFTGNLQLVACELSFQCPFSRQAVGVSIDADSALAGIIRITDQPPAASSA